LLFHHPRGGAVADFKTGQLLDEERRPTSEVYCLVGSLMIGEHLVTNGIGKVSRSASRRPMLSTKNFTASCARRIRESIP